MSELRIGPQGLPLGRPICPSDSIEVAFSGEFPDLCFSFIRVEIIEPPYASPEPRPPLVRLVVEDTCRAICPEVLVPWHARVVLPPLPARFYSQPVEMLVVSCPDALHPDGPDSVTYATDVPFVVEPCDSMRRCLTGGWEPGENPAVNCNALVGPHRPAQVIFTVSSDTSLAGLEGEFNVYPNDLVITDIHTTGPAIGMHLSWRPTDTGAKFNLFAEVGAPIPGDSVPPPNRHPPVPVLALVLEPRAARIPAVTSVTAGALFGSDVDGGAVPQCFILTLVEVEARICAEAGCDFNGDGIPDVRDLVLMAHCVLSRGDSTQSSLCSEGMPDCNGDGRKSLEDVICCALHILRGPSCPGCPNDSSHVRPAPNVQVSLSGPTFTDTGAEVGIRVDELGPRIGTQVGGAVLRLDYPADRYDAELVLPPSDDSWLTLSDVFQGQATIGLVRLSQEIHAVDSTTLIPGMKLRLTLKPGMTHGGSVSLAGAEFSGPDGVKLETPVAHLVVALAGAPRLSLSDAHPNPFAGGTRFQLTLDRPAAVSVGIYDLAGRLVATLHRGSLPGGAHEFVWNGRGDGGAPARGGVYFYRAAAGAVTATRKMVLLGN